MVDDEGRVDSNGEKERRAEQRERSCNRKLRGRMCILCVAHTWPENSATRKPPIQNCLYEERHGYLPVHSHTRVIVPHRISPHFPLLLRNRPRSYCPGPDLPRVPRKIWSFAIPLFYPSFLKKSRWISPEKFIFYFHRRNETLFSCFRKIKWIYWFIWMNLNVSLIVIREKGDGNWSWMEEKRPWQDFSSARGCPVEEATSRTSSNVSRFPRAQGQAVLGR